MGEGSGLLVDFVRWPIGEHAHQSIKIPTNGSYMNRTIGIRLSAMMFLQFFVWGSWYVSVGPYIGAIDGWSTEVSWFSFVGASAPEIIGWAYSVGPIAAIISPFFLGMIADRFFPTQIVLGSLHVVGGVLMLLVPVVTAVDAPDPSIFTLLLFGHMLCYMPTLGLVNTLSFHNMTNQERQFPYIRVFGTLGWIAAGLVVSFVLKADTRPAQFYLTGGGAIVMGLYSFSLPHTPPPSAGKRASVRDILCVDSLALLKNPSFAVFMVCSFLICIPLAAYYAWAPTYVGSIGFKQVAAVMSTGQAAEVIFMIIMPLFFARLGVKWMLAAGMLAWVIRYALFAAAAESQVLWMVIFGIALHGICYDFFFVTGQIYVDKVAPKNLRGQAQGLLVLITLGLGLWIGAHVSTRLVENFTADDGLIDWQSVWTYPSAAAAVILLIFVASFRYNESPTDEGEPTPPNP